MRIFVDINTTNVYDAFSLGFEGILERTLAHHRTLVANHHNERVRVNAEYYRSVVYENHLSSILYKAFGNFNSLISYQLLCINTEQQMVKDDDIVERLTNMALSDTVRELVKFDEQDKLEYHLFDEDVMDLLYGELDEFRDELIRVIRAEVNDALTAAIVWVKNK
ncbi:hypothetical protein STRATTON_236 [Erwinia phage vB_EamM_Stratton]|uniref:Uncharacterized protein n=2 Tax=Erskinevirus EaH2 TaxID=2169883 RepID=A0A1B2IHA4_9CAUD|nr:hypothetical protein G173_gp136 [Erwinia phage phiEaH2]AFQ96681.1 hypothetical protein [Erwinia phage phiEaH2]ANZ50661.1 hypothetical protein STRATTON_236 [Erwinia phage vB_EamM_Stratton]